MMPLLLAAVVVNAAQEAPPLRWIDLAHDSARQAVVCREPNQYLGHVTTTSLANGTSILAAFPRGHGKGAIVLARSDDGGRTWSEPLPTPESFTTSKETPTIHRVRDASGAERLLLFSGLHPTRLATSDDDGRTWSELAPIGDWGGIVAMSSVVPLSAPGAYLALFHDDGRFIAATPQERSDRDPTFTLYAARSADGGLHWSAPASFHADDAIHLCEPGAILSPDRSTIALLLRENARRKRSHLMLSSDDGHTWSTPREVPTALTGDRHVAAYAPDGRLVITFRDRTLAGAPKGSLAGFDAANFDALGVGSPTEGDWVAWVGTWEDLLAERPGQYRVRLGDNLNGWDCGYAGLEVLPDGTIVATTYGTWDAGTPPYIRCVRFRLDELDAMASRPMPSVDCDLAQLPAQATSLLGKPLRSLVPSAERRDELDAALERAHAEYLAAPYAEDSFVWLGRRLAYLGRYRDAIDVFSRGLEIHPTSHRLLRHRAHRWITLREFDRAIADLARAWTLALREPDRIEPDGAPSAPGAEPRSSDRSNIAYHLGLAHHLRGEWAAALDAFRLRRDALANDDTLVASMHWEWQCLKRLGRDDEARALLEQLRPSMDVRENQPYLALLQLYRGDRAPDSMDLTNPAIAYGTAAYVALGGDSERGRHMMQGLVDAGPWAAFGTIAAEAELARGDRVR